MKLILSLAGILLFSALHEVPAQDSSGTQLLNSICILDTNYMDIGTWYPATVLVSNDGYSRVEAVIDTSDGVSDTLFFRHFSADAHGNIIVKTTYPDGKIRSLGCFKDIMKETHTGEAKFWDYDGNLLKVENYNDDGSLESRKTFHPNGQIKRDDYYGEGELISGKCFDSLGNEITYFPFEEQPVIDIDSLQACMKYPEILLRIKVEESFLLTVLISNEGKVVAVRYDNNTSLLFLQNAVGCLADMKGIRPGMSDGKPITCWVTMPITFRIKDK